MSAVVDLTEPDAVQVQALLSEQLEDAYPGGRAWLARRLEEVLAGAASGSVLVDRGEVVGVALSVSKPGGTKLCTLWVAPSRRGEGLGRVLVERESRHRAGPTWITARRGPVADAVAACLAPLGFTQTRTIPDRYGPGEDEVVLTSPSVPEAPAPGYVMSFRPEYAEAILTGRKTHEYRRTHVQARAGERIWVYETAPTRAVVGVVVLGEVLHGGSELAALETDPDLAAPTRAYLVGAGRVSALCVRAAWRIPPMPLQALGMTRPPQSYARAQ